MHFFALVLVPADTPDILTDDVDRLMAPHKETSTSGWWDWYQIGGRWDDVLPPDAIGLVRELPEVRPFTIVTPDLVAHRRSWVGPDHDNGDFVEDEHWDRTAATILLANRDKIAVVVDYHS